MSDEEKTLMAQYGITGELKMIYSYKQHRYENINDAINFAKIDTNHDQDNKLQIKTE